tara:strand:- start:271 stop:1089 length:819 start_codon:yes stop_codon:yes gene_type:complete
MIGDNIEFDGKMDLYKAIYLHLLNKYNFEPLGFTLNTFSDTACGSGLGGSSTLVVSIIKAYSLFFDLNLNKEEIASIAFKVEREDVGIIGGAQDQYAAAYGGFNFMYFNKKNVEVEPLNLAKDIIEELQSSTVLFYTGIQRNASQIEKEKKSLINKEQSLLAMHRIKKNAIQMADHLKNSEILHFATILNESWKNKKMVSKAVSNNKIDNIYNLALNHGAYGGKVSGAGGGGHMFFIIDPIKKNSLINALDKEDGEVVNFKFENEGAYSWIV